MLTEREPSSLSLGRNGQLPTLNIATNERMRLEEILDMCAGTYIQINAGMPTNS